MENDEDFFTENILDNFYEKNKKINCGRKGKAGEREIVKLLNIRFNEILSKNLEWGKFSRSVGSGNRWSQASLSKEAKEVFSGDIVSCKNFKYAIESKKGYDHIDLDRAVIKFNKDGKGNSTLNKFLNQTLKDSERCDKKPLLLWKATRKPILAFLNQNISEIKNITKYNNWFVFYFKDLLKLSDNFFFEDISA